MAKESGKVALCSVVKSLHSVDRYVVALTTDHKDALSNEKLFCNFSIIN
jgi:hypothetical protein